VQLVVVADPSPDALERARRIVNVDVTADSQAAIDRDDVAAVVVCAPPDQHAALALAAVQAGKHVYVEKPLATDVAEGERLVAAAEHSGVVAAIGFNRRYHPLFARARTLVADGAIGRVVGGQAAFCEPIALAAMPDWKRQVASGGGVLLDLATHHVDLVPWLIGGEVRAVEARVSSDASEHDSARVRIRLAGEVEVEGFYSFRAARSDFIELLGDAGVLRVDRYDASLRVWVARGDLHAVRRRRLRPDAATLSWRTRRVLRPADEPSYRRALRAWIDVLGGRERELPTLRDGLDNLRAIKDAGAE
jgi:myo-inositol 2-dehydrogenase / D-chiro-inositol 1-dehydrogenase